MITRNMNKECLFQKVKTPFTSGIITFPVKVTGESNDEFVTSKFDLDNMSYTKQILAQTL